MSTAAERIDDALLRRAYCGFVELSGQAVTHADCCRVLGVDEETCTKLIEALLRAGFLTRRSGGRFARSSEGPLLHW